MERYLFRPEQLRGLPHYVVGDLLTLRPRKHGPVSDQEIKKALKGARGYDPYGHWQSKLFDLVDRRIEGVVEKITDDPWVGRQSGEHSLAVNAPTGDSVPRWKQSA